MISNFRVGPGIYLRHHLFRHAELHQSLIISSVTLSLFDMSRIFPGILEKASNGLVIGQVNYFYHYFTCNLTCVIARGDRGMERCSR